MSLLFVLFICGASIGNAEELAPVVQTSLGPVQGIIETSEDGTVYKYLGIPYASVEPLNSFGDPLMATPWEEVFHANVDGVFCPQREEYDGQLVGTTDCLVLNVFVPNNVTDNAQLPVMVFTHGGGFQTGSARQYVYGSEKIVRHDVILVTHTYRIGPFGFMCLGNDDVPGNAGLKDTLLAYQWVQENIAAFGGDPNNVTSFGESAGAYIVDLMILNPLGKDLFQKAILQSGTVLNRYLKSDYAINQENTLQLAHDLGYEGNTLDGVLPFLSSIEPTKVIETAEALNLYFAPCLENENVGKINFLTKRLYEIYETGNYSKIPMMLGVNDKEGITFTSFIRMKANAEQFYNDFFPSYIYSLAGDYTVRNPEEQAKVAHILRKFYFSDGDMSGDEIIDFVSDIMFVVNNDRALELYLEKAEDPIYYYLFAYDGDRNFFKRQLNITTAGASHADELSYLFLQPFWDGITDRDRIIMDRMTTMWTNFAKHSDPTPEVSELLPIQWKPALPRQRNYLKIDSELSTGMRVFNKRMVFWELLRHAYGEPLRRGMIDFSSELEVKYQQFDQAAALDQV